MPQAKIPGMGSFADLGVNPHLLVCGQCKLLSISDIVSVGDPKQSQTDSTGRKKMHTWPTLPLTVPAKDGVAQETSHPQS